MSFTAIIQARTNSSRLPNKVLLNYKNLTPLSILIKRLKKSKYLKKIIIATTKKKNDDKQFQCIICLEKTNEPMVPEMVLFGLIFVNFLPPIALPKT